MCCTACNYAYTSKNLYYALQEKEITRRTNARLKTFATFIYPTSLSVFLFFREPTSFFVRSSRSYFTRRVVKMTTIRSSFSKCSTALESVSLKFQLRISRKIKCRGVDGGERGTYRLRETTSNGARSTRKWKKKWASENKLCFQQEERCYRMNWSRPGGSLKRL